MEYRDYIQYDGLGLAELVRSGQVSPTELLEVAISRAEQVNPRVNAIITKMYEHAKLAAKNLPDGPFSGVPFLVKDLGVFMKDEPLSEGSACLREQRPSYDSTILSSYRKAGLLIFGKTNLPEFGIMGTTEPQHFGPSCNPWNLNRTPGGSSGGSAAAIAAGIVPIASAGDGGGSIRIPAACCHLFGFKPSRGLVSQGPNRGEEMLGAVVDHALTRSVRDSAALLDVVAGSKPGDPNFPVRLDKPFIDVMQERPKGLRIGFSVKPPLGRPINPECRAAVMDVAEKLSALGHHVEERDPDINGEDIARAYSILCFGHIGSRFRELYKTHGRKKVERHTELTSRLTARMGEALSAADYHNARMEWNRFGRTMGEYHESFDVYLTPTIAELPSHLGELLPGKLEALGMGVIERLSLERLAHRMGSFEKSMRKALRKTPFTQLANLTGQPAMSVPMYKTAAGLPVGAQLSAAIGNDGLLFRVAAQLEEAYPWFDQLAPMTQP